MAADNKLELVVEVDVNKANASIKSVNTGLSGMEQAAGKAARGASAGIDGMTASMVKGATAGNLLADSIKRALDWAREWTIGAAQYAANTERMEVVTKSLAQRHGDSEEAAMKVVEAIKRIGFTMAESEGAVQKMIIADLSLEKAEGLAKVAKDAAAVSTSGLKASEALEQIITAIESGRGRGLRELRIFVDLNKETERAQKLAELHGKTLSENDIHEVRRAAIMREATKLQGSAAAQTGSLKEQTEALGRDVDSLREAVGSQFQGLLKEWVGHLRELVGFLKDNSTLVVKFAEGVLVLAAALGTVTVAMRLFKVAAVGFEAMMGGIAMIRTVAFAISNGLTGALVGAEVALAAVARLIPPVAAGLAVWWAGNKLLEHAQGNKNLDTTAEAIKKINQRLRETPEWWIQRGMTPPKTTKDTIIDYLKTLDSRKAPEKPKHEPTDAELDRMLADRKTRLQAEKTSQEYYMRAVEDRKGAEHDMARARIEDSMKIIEATSSETEAAKESLNVVLLSMQERTAGVAKIREEEKREIERMATRVDEKSGVVQQVALSAAALERIHTGTAEKIAAFDMRFNEEEARRTDAMMKALASRSQKRFEEWFIKPFQQQLYVWQQTGEWQDKIEDQGRSAAISAVEQRKNLQLAQLESVDARTLQDKVALENAKTAIEIQAMKERTRIELEEIDARTERQVDEAKKAAMAQGIFYEPYLDQIGNKIRELGQHEKDALQKATTTEIDVAQVKGATSTRKLVTDQYQSIFQSLKQQAGGVFDALVTKSQSVWSAIGNSLKTALLTAIKDVVTSRVAAMLMNLFVPGANVQMQQGGVGKGAGGGIFGTLGGLLGIGAVPAFAGGAAGGTPPFVPGSSGGGGLGTILPPIFGSGGNALFPGAAVGGTPPFVPSSSGGGAGMGAAPAAGGIFSKAGLAGMLPGLKSFFGFGDNKWVDMGGGRMATGGWIGQYGSFGDKLQALGKSDAALMGGALLAMDGLRRGGKLGVAETTAGGALIGYKFGGPLGAAIGGIAGAVAGIVRLFVKGATEKTKDKIKALYGVDIADKGVLKQIVDMTKSEFGGNIDMAIRSPQIRDLIQLYAMTTGQKTTGMPGTVTPLSLVETGGSLFQSPQYNNGTPLPALGGLPGLDQIGAGTPSGGGLVIQLDGPATTALLQGQAVQAITNNPRLVQSASMAATKSNANRRELTSLQLSPGTIVS
jgi:hypothetical protein